MNAHSFPAHSHIHFDADDEDATIVAPSPFFSTVEEDAVTNPAARALSAPAQPFFPSDGEQAAVHHTFTEPCRGYPAAAAYVPRHEEVDRSVPAASGPALPATLQMPQMTEALPTPMPPAYAPAPAYGRGVVFEGREPLVAEQWSIRFSSEDASDASVEATPAEATGLAASPDARSDAPIEVEVAHEKTAPLSGGGAIFGALLGALAGALLWGGIGWATGGWEFKYGAVLIGFMTGAGAARLAGGHGPAVGVLGAIFGLAGILTGKALFEILVQPSLSMEAHLAYHLTSIDLIFYVATIATGYAVGAGAVAPRNVGSLVRRVLRRSASRVPSMPAL